MGKIIHFFLFVHLLVYSPVQGLSLNISNLINIYINACGEEFLCKEWPGMTKAQHNPDINRCSPCSCSYDCFRNNRCCPDKFFERKISVFQTPFLIKKDSDLSDYAQYALISYCPPDADLETKLLCENFELSTDNENNNDIFPVTSILTNYSYASRRCADCHHETSDKLRKWEIDLTNGESAYLNYITSFSELLSLPISTAIFSPPNDLMDRVMIRQTYSEYDDMSSSDDFFSGNDDIITACRSSYGLRYRIHKNVFCYLSYLMKNQKFDFDLVISECNVTSLWYSYDSSIERACLENPVSVVTFPYKNVYCYRCNLPLLNASTPSMPFQNTTVTFGDFSASFRDGRISETQTFHIFDEIKIHPRFISKSIQLLMNTSDYDRKQTINFNHLTQILTSLDPERVCHPSFPVSCDCTPTCFFHNICNCCVDTALKNPISCLEEYNGVKHNPIAVISHCFNNDIKIRNDTTFKKLNVLCTSYTGKFDSFPVMYHDISYKNIFCFLCNNFNPLDSEFMMDEYKTATVELTCGLHIPSMYFVNFDDIFEAARSLNCIIQIGTLELPLCPEKEIFMNNCYKYGQLRTLNRLMGCKSTGLHPLNTTQKDRNHSCYCSLKKSENNRFFFVNDYIYCSTYQDDCVQCETCSSGLPEMCKFKKSVGIIFKVPLMKELFLPKLSLPDLPLSTASSTSNRTCYPGRKMVGDKCKLFLPVGFSMNYAGNIEVNVIVRTWEKKADVWMKDVRDCVLAKLSEIYKAQDGTITNVFFLPAPRSILSTTDSKRRLAYEFSAYVHYRLYFYSRFDRETVEDKFGDLYKLLSINKNISNTTFKLVGKSSATLRETVEKSSTLFESEKVRFLRYCEIEYKMYARVPFVVNHISDILLCHHIIVGYRGRFLILREFTLKINDDLEYFIGEYVYHADGKISICSEMHPDTETFSFSFLRDRLEMLTTICNLVSMICIAALFMIFIIVRELRTIPGINLMNVLFSLFFMQLSYTISNTFQYIRALCLSFGILLHYFWLSLCCGQFFCCLHMFQSFGSKFKINPTGSHKCVIRNIVITYLLPMCLVVGNIGISYIFSGEIGYGSSFCFVENMISNVLTFILPLTLTCLTNMVFFVTSAIAIVCSERIQSTEENKSYIFPILKLFTTTGLIWILQIIDGFLPISTFSFLTILLTSSQGFIIFLSFASSAKVIRSLRKVFRQFPKDLVQQAGVSPDQDKADP